MRDIMLIRTKSKETTEDDPNQAGHGHATADRRASGGEQPPRSAIVSFTSDNKVTRFKMEETSGTSFQSHGIGAGYFLFN